MTTVKPYVKKPLRHSPKGEMVLAAAEKYLIQAAGGEAYTTDPGQALAAIIACRRAGRPCLVNAVATVLGEETLELVDEEFLMSQMEKRG